MNKKYFVNSLYFILFLIPIISGLNYRAQAVAIILFLVLCIFSNSATRPPAELEKPINLAHISRQRWGKVLIYVFWGMTLWSAIALTWSEAGIEASSRVFKQTGLGILLTALWMQNWGTGLFVQVSRKKIIKILGISFIIGASIFFYRYSTISGSSYWGEGPFMATLALLLIASSTLFWEEKSTRLWTVLVWAICVAAIFTSTNDAVKIAFIMAIIAFGLTLLAPKLTFAMVFICSLALLTVPITYCTVGPDSLATIFPISWIEEIGQLNISFKHRIAIYSFALESSCSHSWAGWGVGSTSLIPGGQEPMAGYRDFLLLPSHPHNMPIQVMLETGIIGLGFVLAIFSTFFVAIYSKINNRPLTATVLGIIVCYLIIASLSYSAWASWFLMTGIFAAMILNLCQKSQKINS